MNWLKWVVCVFAAVFPAVFGMFRAIYTDVKAIHRELFE